MYVCLDIELATRLDASFGRYIDSYGKPHT